jgi:hypothetical protein
MHGNSIIPTPQEHDRHYADVAEEAIEETSPLTEERKRTLLRLQESFDDRLREIQRRHSETLQTLHSLNMVVLANHLLA